MYGKILHTFPLCEKMSLRLEITNSTSGKMKELGFIKFGDVIGLTYILCSIRSNMKIFPIPHVQDSMCELDVTFH